MQHRQGAKSWICDMDTKGQRNEALGDRGKEGEPPTISRGLPLHVTPAITNVSSSSQQPG